MNGRSSARRRIGGSVARRRGVTLVFRLSTLPAGKPFPWTASTSIRVISCDSVLCSAAARRRNDSFNSFGTYAPINTPFRFAINDLLAPMFWRKCRQQLNAPVSRILCPHNVRAAFIHLGRSSPNGSSGLPGNVVRSFDKTGSGQLPYRFPIWPCTARSLPGRTCCHARR